MTNPMNNLPKNSEELKSQAKEAVRLVGDHLNERVNYLRDSTATARYNSASSSRAAEPFRN
jgi:hypothetical protein